ncbi:MAG: hypothetical protein PHD07_01600 [Bacteroidales bacterium]|jgi:hypothetical protein|nr:hypothetical protein [Bacteroidales bacterium]MDD3201746.1 hypothetical protein [Bacteroidales bacterium]
MTNSIPKKRAVISYENMSEELQDAFKEKYPHGYTDYMGDIFKVDKPDGTSFYAVSLEVPDAMYLVKIKVKIDDYDDIENGIFKDESADDADDTEDNAFPDEGADFSGGDDPEETTED